MDNNQENGISAGRILTALGMFMAAVTTTSAMLLTHGDGLPNHNRIRIQQFDHERFLLFSSLSAPLLIFILFLVFNSALALVNIGGLFLPVVEYSRPSQASSLYMSLLVSPLTLYTTYLALTGSSKFRKTCFLLLCSVLAYLAFVLVAAGLYDYKPAHQYQPVMLVFNASHLLLYLIILGCFALLAATILYSRFRILLIIATILLVNWLIDWFTRINLLGSLLDRVEFFALHGIQSVARIPDTTMNFTMSGFAMVATCMLYVVLSKRITQAYTHRSFREKFIQETEQE